MVAVLVTQGDHVLMVFLGILIMGDFLVFPGKCGITSKINVDLLAIVKDLLLSWANGCMKAICEFDCQTTLTLINEDVSHTHPYAHMVSFIRKFKNYNRSLFLRPYYVGRKSCY